MTTVCEAWPRLSVRALSMNLCGAVPYKRVRFTWLNWKDKGFDREHKRIFCLNTLWRGCKYFIDSWTQESCCLPHVAKLYHNAEKECSCARLRCCTAVCTRMLINVPVKHEELPASYSFEHLHSKVEQKYMVLYQTARQPGPATGQPLGSAVWDLILILRWVNSK